jgi:multidrug resistance efflux pump
MPVVALCLVLLIPLTAILTKSDIGQAIADAIRHNSGANEGAAVRRELDSMRAEMEQLRTEVDQVHGELTEAHDRLEFAERLLAGHTAPVLPADRGTS